MRPVPPLLAGIAGNPLFQAAVLTVFVQVPSFADVYKYEPGHTYLAPLLLAVTFAVFAGALIAFPLLPRLTEPLCSAMVTTLVLALVTVAAEVLYHHELARLQAGGGSTAVQAMSGTVQALVHGRGLYSVHLPGGAPVSPGPGWLLLNSPFALAHASPLMDPVWIGVTAVVLRRSYGRGFEVNLGLAMLCCSPAFFRLLGEANDILAIGCAMVLLVVWADRWLGSDVRAVGLGLAVGVVSTARIIYVPVALLLALLIATRDLRRAVIVGAVGMVAALALFAVFAIGVHPYPPFHLFGRANERQPTVMLALGFVVTALMGVGTLLFVQPDATSWFTWFAATFSTAHLLIGLGELAGRRYAFAGWEGANYVMAGAIPVLAAVMAGRVARPDRIESGPAP